MSLDTIIQDLDLPASVRPYAASLNIDISPVTECTTAIVIIIFHAEHPR